MEPARFSCSFCGRPNSNGAPRPAGRCATCLDCEGDALCDTCCAAHASKSAFRGHVCSLVGADERSRGEELLLRLGLTPAPRSCTRHGGLAFTGLTCTACTGTRSDGDSAERLFHAGDLCAACISQHSAAQPDHALVLLRHTPDASSLRKLMGDTAGARVSGCAAAAATAAADPDSGAETQAAETPGPSDTPLVACARHKAASVADELEALHVFRERALQQAVDNRDAALAAVQARFEALTAGILAAVTAKHAALTAELAAADAALAEASASTGTLKEVSAASEGFVVIQIDTRS